MSRRIGLASLIWSLSILLSRVIGLVREAVFGRVVGGGLEADLYFAAFILPDFLNYLLAAGALSIVFIPIFGGYLAKGEEERGWEAFSVISTFLIGLLAVALTAGWFAVPALSNAVFSFDAEATDELVRLTRIVLPAQAFHVIGGLLSAALQARDKHSLPALAPLVYTGCIIGGGLLGGPDAGASGFAWGVLVGSVLGPFGLPLVGCLRMGLRWRPVLSVRHPDLRTYLWRSLPIMLAFSIVMWDDWLLKSQGSKLAEGSVATLQYAKTLLRVPMGVFGVAVGTAAFPTLARLVAEGELDGAYRTLASAVKRMLVLALGAQVALTCAGPQIARVIYGGRLPPEQHDAIGLALGIMCLGLWGWAAQTVVARGFYALGKTWLPSLLGSVVVLAAWPVYAALGKTHGVVGLAASSSLAISTYVLALGLLLRREFPGVPDGFGPFALRAVPGVAAGLGAGYAVSLVLPSDLVPLPEPWASLVHGAVLGGVGGVAYLVALLALRLPEVTEVLGIVQRRLRR